MTDWTKRFIDMADLVASWSKDNTKVGAVIVRPDKTVASVGFNGFPRKHSDAPALYADRDYKLKHIIHAEANAIDNCHDFTNRAILPAGYGIYQTHPPCRKCAVEIFASGIDYIYFRKPADDFVERWGVKEVLDYLDEHGIEYHSYDPTRTPPTH
jgi:dCMP deaminase